MPFKKLFIIVVVVGVFSVNFVFFVVVVDGVIFVVLNKSFFLFELTFSANFAVLILLIIDLFVVANICLFVVEFFFFIID